MRAADCKITKTISNKENDKKNDNERKHNYRIQTLLRHIAIIGRPSTKCK